MNSGVSGTPDRRRVVDEGDFGDLVSKGKWGDYPKLVGAYFIRD